MHANREPEVHVDEPMIMQRLEELRSSSAQEVVWRDNFGRDGTAYVLRLLSGAPGLYAKQYGRGRNTLICVSKVPLPDYRADLDERHGKQRASVAMSSDGQEMVRSLLARGAPSSAQPQQRPQSSPAALSQQARLARAQELRGEQDAKKLRADEAAPAGPVAESWEDGSSDEEGDEAAAPPSAATAAPGGGATPAPAADARLAAESERLLSQLTAQRQSPEFTKMLAFRKKLPSYSRRTELVAALRSSQVLVVSGETGCGKTTQVPQFLLDDAIESGEGARCQIICTQPRRISAISVAERVAAERAEPIGQTVGTTNPALRFPPALIACPYFGSVRAASTSSLALSSIGACACVPQGTRSGWRRDVLQRRVFCSARPACSCGSSSATRPSKASRTSWSTRYTSAA